MNAEGEKKRFFRFSLSYKNAPRALFLDRGPHTLSRARASSRSADPLASSICKSKRGGGFLHSVFSFFSSSSFFVGSIAIFQSCFGTMNSLRVDHSSLFCSRSALELALACVASAVLGAAAVAAVALLANGERRRRKKTETKTTTTESIGVEKKAAEFSTLAAPTKPVAAVNGVAPCCEHQGEHDENAAPSSPPSSSAPPSSKGDPFDARPRSR